MRGRKHPRTVRESDGPAGGMRRLERGLRGAQGESRGFTSLAGHVKCGPLDRVRQAGRQFGRGGREDWPTGQANSMRPVLPGRWIALAWLGLVFSSVILSLIGVAVRGNPAAVVPRLGLSGLPVFALSLHVAGSALAAGILGRKLRRAGMTWETVGLKGRLSGRSLAWALAGMVTAAGLYMGVDWFSSVARFPMYWSGAKAGDIRLATTLDRLCVIGFAVLLGPAVEEILFRGYVFTTLRARGMRLGSSLLLSGLVFASVHCYFGPGVLLFISIWSVIPALLYYKFNSLYPAMLFHTGNNLLAHVIVPLFLS
jgi:membrane protease YdiL (CAAX protease family)